MSRSRLWRALILTSGGNGTLAGLNVLTVGGIRKGTKPSGWRRELIGSAPSVVYFKPSLMRAESSLIDSRMRLSRVSGRLAV